MSEARPQTPHVPKRVSASLKGELEGSATTDHTDKGESLGVVDDPVGMVDDPGGHAKHTAVLKPSEMTTSQVVEANSPRPLEDPGDTTDVLRII